jgi:predicted nucleic acid-binding protein
MHLSGWTAVILDTTPLGLLTQRPGHIGGDTCRAWYASLTAAGHRFFVPEIVDYELRRKMRQADNINAISRLDGFVSIDSDRYLPLTTPAVRLAADLWAQARRTGHVTAPPEALVHL